MIKLNRYLVYEFDETGKTALHWACKRNNCEILEIIISNGAELDKVDLVNFLIFSKRFFKLFCN